MFRFDDHRLCFASEGVGFRVFRLAGVVRGIICCACQRYDRTGAGELEGRTVWNRPGVHVVRFALGRVHSPRSRDVPMIRARRCKFCGSVFR
jgi:hypothetical protein